MEEPPLFIEPPELGFHVAVGIPQNIFFVGNTYYLFRNNAWFAAPHYRGPWVVTRYNALPWKLRRYPFERVRYYRDAGYRHYREGRDAYWRSHQFRPNKEWKEAQKAERKQAKQDWKDERKWEKEQRKQEWKGSRGGKDDSWQQGGHGNHGQSGHGGGHGRD
jgi:hypothetical protein